MLPIRTKRLMLRRFQDSDVNELFAYRSDTEVGRYQGWHPSTLEEVREFVGTQQHNQLDTPGKWFQVAIARQDTQALIGDVGLCLVNSQTAEIGFTLARPWQGMGLAHEAVSAIMEVLLRTARIRTMQANVDTRNVKSIALLTRLGFEYKRTTQVMFHGQWCEEHRYQRRYA